MHIVFENDLLNIRTNYDKIIKKSVMLEITKKITLNQMIGGVKVDKESVLLGY